MVPPPLPAASKKRSWLKTPLIATASFICGAVFTHLPAGKERSSSASEAAPNTFVEPAPDPAAEKLRVEREQAAAKERAEKREKREAEVASRAKEEAAAMAKTVPKQVEELARTEFKDEFRSVKVAESATGEGWVIHVEVSDPMNSGSRLRESITRLASFCHPEGLKVADFTLTASEKATDGLGNEIFRPAVAVKLRRDVAGKVNWRNFASLDFHKVFETTDVSSSFEKEWGGSPPAESRRPLPVSITKTVETANALSKAAKSGLKLTKYKEDETSVQYSAGDPQRMVLSFMRKDKDIARGAFLIAAGDGTLKSGTDIVLGIIFTIRASDPKMGETEAAKMAMQMVEKANAGESAKAEGDACSFSLTRSDQVGTIFTVDPR
jgi:hypothetical protein